VLGGILADGMGLGKTSTVLAVIADSLKEAEDFADLTSRPSKGSSKPQFSVKSTLVVVPASRE